VAADRGRDLQFRVLSDLSQLDLDEGARQLDDLGDAGKTAGDKLGNAFDDAGRSVDDLGDKTRGVGRDIADNVEPATRGVDDLGDKARDVATRVGRAFEDISRSSRTNVRKVDDDLDDAKKGLDDFKEEAAGSGREAAASFSGGFDDITGFIQETAANAFSGFGPLGAAAGVAAAAGIGVLTKLWEDNKQKAEEAKEEVRGWVDAFVEGQGRIQEAAIQTKLQELLGDPDTYKQIATDATEAGIAVADYARAKAGDAEQAKKVSQRVRELSDALDANQSRTTESEAATLDQANALKRVAKELGITTGNISTAESAWKDLDQATRNGIVANLSVDVPTPAQLDAINRRVRSGIGRIVIPLEVGQNPYTNNANNSRYRY